MRCRLGPDGQIWQSNIDREEVFRLASAGFNRRIGSVVNGVIEVSIYIVSELCLRSARRVDAVSGTIA
jgi:hypothetical protein